MKRKIKLSKGLSINKEAIAKLQESQMAQLKGGDIGMNSDIRIYNTTRNSCRSDSCGDYSMF